MPEPTSLRDSAPLWLAVGGVVAALSAAPLVVGASEKAPGVSIWDNGWIVLGLAVALLGFLALLWSLVLLVAHRYSGLLMSAAQRREAAPSPSALPAPGGVRLDSSRTELRGIRRVAAEEGLPLPRPAAPTEGSVPRQFAGYDFEMNDLTELGQLVHAIDPIVDPAGLSRTLGFLDVDFGVVNSSVHLLIARSVEGHIKAEDVGVIDREVEFRKEWSGGRWFVHRKQGPVRVGIRIWLEANARDALREVPEFVLDGTGLDVVFTVNGHPDERVRVHPIGSAIVVNGAV